MKKKITIGDIAKALDISKTTVSFVLNGKARANHISIKLEQKILEYIKEVGYKPNQFAQGLRTGKTKIIGVMVEDISDPFFSSIARIIEECAYEKGYKIFFSSTENNTQRTKDLLQVYRTRQVDGYIIVPPPGIEQELHDLIDDEIPIVIFDRTLPGINTNSVLVDNFQSTYKAIQHFISNGYQKIGMITLASDQVQMLERQRGYEQAMDEIGQPYIIQKVIYHDQKAHVIRDIQDFISNHKELDAIFFGTNYIAENGLEAIRNLKVRIPEDIGVIVFDDYNFFRLFTPSITAISQPVKEISETVINLMLNLLSDSESSKGDKNIVLPSTLMVRESSLSKKEMSDKKETTKFAKAEKIK